MISKLAQDSPRCLKMAPKMLQEGPISPQDGSNWPKGSPRTKEVPKRPKSFNT